MRTIIFTALLFLTLNTLCAQEFLYVTAENGLIIREEPDKSSKRIGKFVYAEKVEVLEKTGIAFSITDEGKKIDGTWLKVEGKINGGYYNGYVFSGFLTDEALSKRMTLKFKDVEVQMDYVELCEENGSAPENYEDTARLSVALGGEPGGKFLKIKGGDYKDITVLQRYETSITIMNEGPHCDLTEWKHYYSEWQKLPFDPNKNAFKTLEYTGDDGSAFVPVNIDEFKEAVKKTCGEEWWELVKGVSKIDEYPTAVSVSRIFLKIILTDKNNKTTEKIIEFEIPMGC